MKAAGWGLAGGRGSQVGTVLLSQQLLEAPFHALLLLSRLAVSTSPPPDPPEVPGVTVVDISSVCLSRF